MLAKITLADRPWRPIFLVYGTNGWNEERIVHSAAKRTFLVICKEKIGDCRWWGTGGVCSLNNDFVFGQNIG